VGCLYQYTTVQLVAKGRVGKVINFGLPPSRHSIELGPQILSSLKVGAVAEEIVPCLP
jgi:hypothetical protein